MAVRRELAIALRKVDEEMVKEGNHENIGGQTKLTGVQTGIFASALRVVEFWNPDFEGSGASSRPDQSQVANAESLQHDIDDPIFTHGLSTKAWKVAQRKHKKIKHGLEPILYGPLAMLTFPTVSPRHLKAAISILSPSKEFAPPKRRDNPAYHEPAVQNGIQKLLLLAARVEGKVFDMDGTRWVGGIQGGIEGLRGQLVAMLQGFGAGVTSTLEAASRSLYITVEGRRGMLEEEEKQTGQDGSGHETPK